MKQNVGIFDRTIRVLIAAILAILYFTGVVTGTTGIVFLILAVILLLTGALRVCGLYALFGINTCKNRSEDSQ
ncbi:MAG: YgaP family membrane protein [Bacteroidota bacterium]